MTDSFNAGFNRFAKDSRFYHEDGKSGLMQQLALNGQTPEHFVVSCSDSRSTPALVSDADPGDLFEHKAIGAIVRPFDEKLDAEHSTALTAALEVGITMLGIRKITVLGHTQCAAVEKLVDSTDNRWLAGFLKTAHQAVASAEAEHRKPTTNDNVYRIAEKETALLSAKNLTTYPMVRDLYEKGELTIEARVFDLGAGRLLQFDHQQGEYLPVAGRVDHSDDNCGCHHDG